MQYLKLVLLLLIFIFINHQQVLCDDELECKIIKEYPNGCLLIQANNKTYLAITENIEREMLNMKRDLLDAERKILLKDSLLASYDIATAMYDTTIKNLKNYILELEKVLAGYKGLLHDYKKLKEPSFKLEGGLGATGKDYKPAAIIGLGIKDFRVWGIFQERNSGFMIGKQFQLF